MHISGLYNIVPTACTFNHKRRIILLFDQSRPVHCLFKKGISHMQQVKYSSSGLTEAQAEERKAQGLSNTASVQSGKSIKQIILSNTLTYFNVIFFILTILLCIVQSFRNLTFLPIVIGNTLVGIIQEIRAKKVLDQMNLLNAPHAVVIRDGKQLQVRSEELVKDDSVIFSSGNQICADARVLEGSVIVNESLLTGEEDEIRKGPGDVLLSGSYVISGECCAVLEKVGNESYISALTAEAKKTRDSEQSEMIRSINRIVKWMGILLIPIGGVLFYQAHFINHETFGDSIVSMVAAVIGMIPEGLYLLTTVALALGTIRLARRKVLLNDMKSIEALARVDVLCVDKTGTITEPKMQLQKIIPAKDEESLPEHGAEELLFYYASASPDNNATMEALRAFLRDTMSDKKTELRNPVDVLPFSSAVKYGAVTFEEGTWILGAPECVLGEDTLQACRSKINPYIRKGYRVLAFAFQKEPIDTPVGDVNRHPVCFLALSNAIRENAEKTFQYFKNQGVAIKVISGDNPETVSEIAKNAGIENAGLFVNAATLDTDAAIEKAAQTYTVFGRVTPRQKQKLVQALQKQGHTVAMTGDGVNDILAMKTADCSIAMASGSEAVSQAAQVVLMDSDFAHMPNVVAEGRRVVNNIQRSASLFLVKNIFSVLLSIMASVLMLTYPLEPAHISLISLFTIGVPGFLLALESNKKRIDGNFLKNVLIRALPAGLTDTIIVGSLTIFGQVFDLPKGDVATVSTLVLSVVGFMILYRISTPFNKYRLFVFLINITGIILSFALIPDFFSIARIPITSVLLTIIFCFAAESLFRILTWITEHGGSYVRHKWKKWQEKRQQND